MSEARTRGTNLGGGDSAVGKKSICNFMGVALGHPIRMPGRETREIPALLGAGGRGEPCFVASSGHGGNPREVPAARCPIGDAPAASGPQHLKNV